MKNRSILLLICGAILFCGCQQNPAIQDESETTASSPTSQTPETDRQSETEKLLRFEQDFPAMGVVFRFTGYASDEDTAQIAFDAARERVETIEAALSNYEPTSQAMQLTDSAPHGEPVSVDTDLWNVLQYSANHYRKSKGCFDPSIGALTVLWRAARDSGIAPTEEQIAGALERSGMDKIALANRTVAVSIAGMELDFGGIGKGYAADAAVVALRSNGVAYCLVDASGDIRFTAPPPGKDSWSVDVQTGFDEQLQTLELSNCAVATSGDLSQFVEIGEVRYSHIVDPRTGIALTGSRAVTVIAPDATTADALASAISVLGEADGIEYAQSWPGVQARVVWRDEAGEVQIATTPDFPAQ